MRNHRGFIFFAGWFVLLWSFVISGSEQTDAFANRLSEKFSQNQSQFEKAISNLNFNFSNESIERLKNDLAQTDEILQIQKQMKEAESQLNSLELELENLGDEEASFRATLRQPQGIQIHRDGFILPPQEEWIVERYKDWGLLWEEIMAISNDFFKLLNMSTMYGGYTYDLEGSFELLVRKAIRNILSKGHLVWFDMTYVLPDPIFFTFYSKGKIEDKEKYIAHLKEQVLTVIFDWINFYRQTKSYSGIPQSYELPESYLISLQKLIVRLYTFEAAMKRSRNLRSKAPWSVPAFEDREEWEEWEELWIALGVGASGRIYKNSLKLTLEFMNEDDISFIFPHVPPFSRKRYNALEEMFKKCYSRVISSSVFPDFFLTVLTRKDVKLGENDLFSFIEESLDHEDSYCRMIGIIVRQLYLEHELELYKKYISESGDFYEIGIKLKERIEILEKQWRETYRRLEALEAIYRKELDKDNNWRKYFGFGANQETLQSIHSKINRVNSNKNRTSYELKFIKILLRYYRQYNHSEEIRHLEELRAEMELESVSEQWSEEVILRKKGSIDDMLQRIQKKRDRITHRIEQLESLASRYRSEYEEAEADLASLSFEQIVEELEEEWAQTANGLFGFLAEKHEEYKRVAVRRKELQDSIHQTRDQILKLKERLSTFGEEPAVPSPFRKAYLELKIKVISDLTNSRPPKLEDVFNGLLLQHYQFFKEEDSVSFNDFLRGLDKLSEKEEVSIVSFKPVYEQEIAGAYHQGRPLIYNREFSNVAHPIKINRVQCYSGTLLFYVLTELAELTAVPRFALFTKGHILPGLLSDKGEELLGVETTAEGRGIVEFGPVSELSGEIQVVEVYSFLLIELLKSEISNFSDLYKASQDSLRKYGFVVENLRSYDSNRMEKSGKAFVERGSDILNATPFGFGSSDALSGDRKRDEITEESIAFYGLKSDKKQIKGETGKGISIGGGLSDISISPPDFLEQPASEEEEAVCPVLANAIKNISLCYKDGLPEKSSPDFYFCERLLTFYFLWSRLFDDERKDFITPTDRESFASLLFYQDSLILNNLLEQAKEKCYFDCKGVNDCFEKAKTSINQCMLPIMRSAQERFKQSESESKAVYPVLDDAIKKILSCEKGGRECGHLFFLYLKWRMESVSLGSKDSIAAMDRKSFASLLLYQDSLILNNNLFEQAQEKCYFDCKGANDCFEKAKTSINQCMLPIIKSTQESFCPVFIWTPPVTSS